MRFEPEEDVNFQLDLLLNEGLDLHDNFSKPIELGIESEFNKVQYTWPDSNPSDQGILFNDGAGALSWVERISNTQDVLDVLISLGLVKSGGPIGYYGEIYASDVNDELTIGSSGQSNRVLITSFTVNGPSAGTTPDYANNQITINSAGVYLVVISIAVEGTGGASATIGFAAYKNTNTELVNIHAHRDIAAGGGDVGSVALSGLETFAASDTLKVYLWNEDNTNNVVIDDISLSITRVGA